MAQLLYLVKSARITQWIKNLAVFAPIVFSGFLFTEGKLIQVIWAFAVFSVLSSAIYIFNDIVDIKKDLEHPYKKFRPIASGKMPIHLAVYYFFMFAGVSLFWASQLSFFFFLAAIGYFVLNITYSLWWKKIAILDLLSIAAGFVLRVYGGAFVINVHMDVWFLLTVVSASMFLAVGKRRSEMTLIIGRGMDLSKQRKTLMNYTPALLDSYTSMFANTTWLTYTLFTFLHPTIEPEGRVLKLYSLLPSTLMFEKWLMITVPVVIYGVMRYLLLIYEKNKGESPHRVLLTDLPLLTTVVVLAIMLVGVIYFV